MNVPDHLRYTADHEWARLEDGRVRMGITDFAQEALGDVVFVQLPQMGGRLEAGGPCSEVESTKSVSDVYAPVAGEVVEVNEGLVESPQRINEDPYGQGWICVIAPDGPTELSELLRPADYRQIISGEKGPN